MATLPAALADAGIELLFQNRAHPYNRGSGCSAPGYSPATQTTVLNVVGFGFEDQASIPDRKKMHLLYRWVQPPIKWVRRTFPRNQTGHRASLIISLHLVPIYHTLSDAQCYLLRCTFT
jgi:hypothetical protein